MLTRMGEKEMEMKNMCWPSVRREEFVQQQCEREREREGYINWETRCRTAIAVGHHVLAGVEKS